MRVKLKWRAGSEGPLAPELFESMEGAKVRGRELLSRHGGRLAADVWNEDEEWQIVTSSGFAEWCQGL